MKLTLIFVQCASYKKVMIHGLVVHILVVQTGLKDI